MIIPKHRVCNFCGKEVGINKRYFIIKSKNIIDCYAGTMSDNKNYDICEDCMHEFATYLHSKLRGKEVRGLRSLWKDKNSEVKKNE